MKKIVYLIVIISLTFLFNIVLYYFSDNYSFFLKNIKYGDDIISNDSKNITDDYLLETKNLCECDCIKENLEIPKENQTPIIQELIEVPEIIETKDSSLDIQKVLSKFLEFYTLEEKIYDEYYQIFDITDEYPRKYVSYFWENLEIYFFTWSEFEQIYNMFNFLTTEISIKNKFSLNKTDTFWKKSFFINLENPDDFVRIVVDDWNILFWLKVKKSYYNDVKNILKNF